MCAFAALVESGLPFFEYLGPCAWLRESWVWALRLGLSPRGGHNLKQSSQVSQRATLPLVAWA